MRRKPKKILGAFGLVLVVAMTVAAILMPGPETNAATEDLTEVVDTISVRVVGSQPNVEIVGIAPGADVAAAQHDISFPYENVEYLSAEIKYVDKNGNVATTTLADGLFTDYNVGTWYGHFNFLDGNLVYDDGSGEQTKTLDGFGYGEYTITVRGVGYGDVTDVATLNFAYVPVVATVTNDGDVGGQDVNIKLDYEADDGTEAGEGKVAKIEVNIYDADGNKITPLSPIWVTWPTNNIAFNPQEYGLKTGDYKVEVIAYDRYGNVLYKPYITYFQYIEPSRRVVPVPDTGGGLMGSLNISNTDYLITGLLVFFAVGVGGAIFIIKRGRRAPAVRKKISRKRR